MASKAAKYYLRHPSPRRCLRCLEFSFAALNALMALTSIAVISLAIIVLYPLQQTSSLAGLLPCPAVACSALTASESASTVWGLHILLGSGIADLLTSCVALAATFRRSVLCLSAHVTVTTLTVSFAHCWTPCRWMSVSRTLPCFNCFASRMLQPSVEREPSCNRLSALQVSIRFCILAVFAIHRSWDTLFPPSSSDHRYEAFRQWLFQHGPAALAFVCGIVGLQTLLLLLSFILQSAYSSAAYAWDQVVEDDAEAIHRPLLHLLQQRYAASWHTQPGGARPFASRSAAGPSGRGNKERGGAAAEAVAPDEAGGISGSGGASGRVALPPSRSPTRKDAWSVRMRQQYDLDTSRFTYDPTQRRSQQNAAGGSGEEEGGTLQGGQQNKRACHIM